MGIIVDLSREAEERLTVEAARRGMPPPQLARILIGRQLPAAEKRGTRPARRPTGRGKFARVSISSADFVTHKLEEIVREDRGWRPHPSI